VALTFHTPSSAEVKERVELYLCHHGMAHPQVADAGTPSNMEGSCEYIERAVVDSRQGVVLQLGNWPCYETYTRASDWNGPSVRTELAHDRGRCRVLVNAVMNLRVSYSAGNFLTS
jgi:hypothetical protein